MSDTRFYECMFLVDANWASNDFDAVSESIESKVSKYGGTVRRMERWQNEIKRKLAYPIRQERTEHTHGTYVLCALELPPEAPSQISREVELDSQFLRALILSRRKDEIDRIFEPFPETDSRGRPIRAGEIDEELAEEGIGGEEEPGGEEDEEGEEGEGEEEESEEPAS